MESSRSDLERVNARERAHASCARRTARSWEGCRLQPAEAGESLSMVARGLRPRAGARQQPHERVEPLGLAGAGTGPARRTSSAGLSIRQGEHGVHIQTSTGNPLGSHLHATCRLARGSRRRGDNRVPAPVPRAGRRLSARLCPHRRGGVGERTGTGLAGDTPHEQAHEQGGGRNECERGRTGDHGRPSGGRGHWRRPRRAFDGGRLGGRRRCGAPRVPGARHAKSAGESGVGMVGGGSDRDAAGGAGRWRAGDRARMALVVPLAGGAGTWGGRGVLGTYSCEGGPGGVLALFGVRAYTIGD